jgi:hypothetical protein
MTLNLDKTAANRSQAMIGACEPSLRPTLERLATKALGVLQEQGVYALMLFLFSRSSNEGSIAPVMRKELYQALAELPLFSADGNASLPDSLEEDKPDSVLSYYTNEVLGQLDKMLLVRDLYEQILIYTRYGAKAANGG